MQGLPLNRGIAGFSGKCGTHFLNTLCTVGSQVGSINNGTSVISGTYIVPKGVYALYVRVWGAPGGSEGTAPSHGVYGEVYENVSARGGGGGRGYSAALLPVSPGRQIPYRIGNPGVYGGVSAGTTTFGNLQVTGGGNASGTTAGSGGVASGGDVNFNGGSGSTGLTLYRDAAAPMGLGGLGGSGSDLGPGGTGGKPGTIATYYYGYNGYQGYIGGTAAPDGGSGVNQPAYPAVTAALPAATKNALLRVLSEAEVHNLSNIYRSAYRPKILALSLGYTLEVADGYATGGIIYLDPIYSKLQ